MKGSILGALAPALVLGLAVACGDKETTDSGDTGSTADGTDGSGGTDGSEGADVFANNCAGCHGADGNSGSAPDLSDEVPGKSDSELESVILNGVGSMPGLSLSAGDVTAVVTYLRATFP